MKTLSIDALTPGMILARTIINDNLIVVLAENTLLTAAHIHRLKSLGIESVKIKDDYDLSPQNLIVQAMISQSHAFVAEYQEILKTTEKLLTMVTKTAPFPAAKMKTLVNQSISPMVKKSGIIDYLYELKYINNSTYNHSLRVSILTGVIAKWMNLGDKEINNAVLSGLLHDIGKTQIDAAIVEKNINELTPAEYESYIQHTLTGHQMVAEKEDLDNGIKQAILQHHERNDGSGFPFNAHANEIHLYAKLVAVADLYDNLTTEHEGLVKQTPFSAIANITKEMFTSLDPIVCIPFLSNIQQVFIGSEIQLSNKRRGKIIQYPKDFAALPIVCIEKNEIIDLNLHSDLFIIEYNPSSS